VPLAAGRRPVIPNEFGLLVTLTVSPFGGGRPGGRRLAGAAL